MKKVFKNVFGRLQTAFLWTSLVVLLWPIGMIMIIVDGPEKLMHFLNDLTKSIKERVFDQ